MMLKNIFTIILFLAVVKVNAQVVTIPDSSFNAFLLSDTTININQDSLIQLSEAQAITALDVSSANIQDLSGINSFTSLTKLNCSNNQLTMLDISHNVELDTLTCDANNLSSVCINSKQALQTFEFAENWIKDINCQWSTTNCSVENDSCFALFYTTYDTLDVLFTVWVDSLSTVNGVSFEWAFGDSAYSASRSPSHLYECNCTYTLCMKVFTSSGDSCEYCHEYGLDSVENIFRHQTSGFSMRVVHFDDLVGIAPTPIKQFNYKLKPNPTNGLVDVAFDNVANNTTVTILTLVGQVIAEQKNSEGGTFHFDISNEAAGVYIIEVNQNGMLSRSKLIKK